MHLHRSGNVWRRDICSKMMGARVNRLYCDDWNEGGSNKFCACFEWHLDALFQVTKGIRKCKYKGNNVKHTQHVFHVEMFTWINGQRYGERTQSDGVN